MSYARLRAKRCTDYLNMFGYCSVALVAALPLGAGGVIEVRRGEGLPGANPAETMPLAPAPIAASMRAVSAPA